MKDLVEFIELLFAIVTRNPFIYIPMLVGLLYFVGVETGVITPEMREHTVNPAVTIQR